MSKETVLLIGGLTHTNKEWKEYSSKYNLKVGAPKCTCPFMGLTASQEYQTGSRKDFLQKLRDREYDDVVGLYRSNNSTSVREFWGAKEKIAENLCTGNRAFRQGIDITAPEVAQVHLPQWRWL
jgi:hypothetical protein